MLEKFKVSQFAKKGPSRCKELKNSLSMNLKLNLKLNSILNPISNPILKYFSLCLILFGSFESFGDESSIGVRAKVVPPYTDQLNRIYAAPELGLKSRPDYHLGIGLIEGVPKSKVIELVKELRGFLMRTHNILEKPMKFEIKTATTFHRIHSNNYSDESLILLPVEEDRAALMELNLKLQEFTDKKSKEDPQYRKIHFDRPTSPTHYIPHITVLTPSDDRKRIVDSAINEIVGNPKKYNMTIFLTDYCISEKK